MGGRGGLALALFRGFPASYSHSQARQIAGFVGRSADQEHDWKC